MRLSHDVVHVRIDQSTEDQRPVTIELGLAIDA